MKNEFRTCPYIPVYTCNLSLEDKIINMEPHFCRILNLKCDLFKYRRRNCNDDCKIIEPKEKQNNTQKHRSKQTNTKSANIKINKKIVKICSKFKVDNCTQVRLSSG